MNSSPAREALAKWERDTKFPVTASEGNAFIDGHSAGWNACADAAARMAENWSVDAQSDCQDIAAAILALKGEQS